MKKFIITLAAAGLVAAPVLAADATTNTTTTTSTDVITTQDSGISLSGKAKVLPNASITTGDNTSTTEVRTSVDNDSGASVTRSRSTSVENKSYHRESGKGHKYGHDKHDN